MPNKSYIRGRAFEWEVQKEAFSRGAIMSFRSSGSHGQYDVISFFPKGTASIDPVIVLTQCKTKLVDEPKETKVSEHIEFGKFTVVGEKRTKYIRRKK